MLYFDNFSRDSADAYLAEGLTEDIIVRLGQVGRLVVKSRSAVRRFRERVGDDPAVLGRELGVAHLVGGSVRRAGGRLRVTVELVRASTGVQVWAEQYDRSDADLLAIEEDVAGAVAAGIAGRLLPSEAASLARRPTRSAEAYDHFLRGNYLIGQRSARAAARGIEEYEAALRADPSFTTALARVAFAHALVIGWEWPGAPPETTLARGFAAVDRALRLDSGTADAWAARGLLLTFRDRRIPSAALQSLQRAVRLDPRNPEAQHILGWFWFVTGNDSAATAQWRRALALEPERPVTLYYMGLLAYTRRRFAEAQRLAESTLTLDPRFYPAYTLRASARAQLGELAAAHDDAEQALRLADIGIGRSLAETAAGLVESRSGDTAAVRRRLEGLLARRADWGQSGIGWAMAVATMYGLLGEADRAVNALGQMPGYSPWWILFQQPDWDGLRLFPRFQQLVEAIRPVEVRP